MSNTQMQTAPKSSTGGKAGLPRKWWAYALVAAVLICGFLGYRSASTAVPEDSPIVRSTSQGA
jgi:hypothetical protein